MPAERHDRPAPRDLPRDSPQTRRALAAGQRATTLVLLAVLMSSLPHPWSLLALVTALGGLVLALLATTWQARAGRWGWAAWHLVAVSFAGYLLWAGSLQAMYPGQVASWSSCSKAANTYQAQALCDTALGRSTPAWFSRVLGLA
ncbi:hypothetical protein [Arsenicicoccus dermatophilus]|uniref:hypothetical protein n=1 Tax=Arsenicicoccus dermatophilus TaxID=1076331 RepID=UPI003916F974